MNKSFTNVLKEKATLKNKLPALKVLKQTTVTSPKVNYFFRINSKITCHSGLQRIQLQTSLQQRKWWSQLYSVLYYHILDPTLENKEQKFKHPTLPVTKL